MRNKKLGRRVAIVGAGMSKFGAFPDKTTRDLFVILSKFGNTAKLTFNSACHSERSEESRSRQRDSSLRSE